MWYIIIGHGIYLILWDTLFFRQQQKKTQYKILTIYYVTLTNLVKNASFRRQPVKLVSAIKSTLVTEFTSDNLNLKRNWPKNFWAIELSREVNRWPEIKEWNGMFFNQLIITELSVKLQKKIQFGSNWRRKLQLSSSGGSPSYPGPVKFIT